MNESSVSETGTLAALGAAYFHRRYTLLFYSLLLTLAAGPVVASLGLDPNLIELFVAANLVAAVLPISSHRGRRLLLLGTVLAAVLLRLATGWLNQATLAVASLVICTGLGLCTAALALRFALSAGAVGRQHVDAALSAYLLAGVFFGSCYWALEQSQPGAFTFTGAFSRTGALYFSFVTLTTLGYGDIAPHSDVARGLAIVEGVGGQLFLAVLIARLVSLYSQRKETRETDQTPNPRS